MKKRFNKFLTLLAVLLLGFGQMWADTELCSATLNGISSNSNTTGIAQTGCTMKWNSVTYSGSDVITIGTVNFYKFSGSSSYVQLVLTSGSFQAGDELTVTLCSNASSGKTKSVQYSLHSDSGNKSEAQNVGSASPTDVAYTLVAADIESDGSIKIFRGGNTNIRFGSFSVTRAGGGGGDPVDPVFTYTASTYTIGDPALDLSTKLSSTNTVGAITFAVSTSDAGTTGASIASDKNFAATTAGTATITVSQVASTGYNAHSEDITVTVVEPDPCHKYFYFTKAADATTAGVTNNEGGFFTVSASGSNGTTGSITLDGTTYNCTNRTSNATTLATFTIPANKKGDLYGLLMSSGSSARGLLLDGVSTGVSCEGGTSELHNIEINNIVPGTHTLTADGNTRVGMFIMKVCDATFRTITLEYADGTTPDGSLSVLDGEAATKPADPTWAHHRFAGWYNGASPYDWASTVSGDITLTAHWTQLYTITYAAGDGTATGDAPTQEDKAEGETFTVAANTFEVAGKDFVNWNDGVNDYDPDDIYTVGTENIVLTAQWKAEADKYTVIFKDGETTLDTKLFEVGSNPSDADIDKTKPLFAFAAWQKDAADIALDDAYWATVVKDASVTLTARWTKAYATSYDMEAYAASVGASKAGLEAALTAANYAFTNINGIDNEHTHNYTYDGMKYKTTDGDLSFNVLGGKVVEVKTGHLPTNDAVTMYINGVADATVFEGANEDVETHKTNYFYSAAEALYRLEVLASKGTCSVKKVTIRDPFTVTFNANGGEPVASQYGHPAVTLPDASNGTKSLLGWFDAAEGGNKIGDVGESYTPAADIELFAQWEDVSTDARLASITLDPSTGVWEPAFNPEIVNYTYTMPYGTAAVPQITSATAVNAGGSYSIVSQASAWDETAVIRGVAASSDTKAYNITMKIAPKDGTCIVKAELAAGSSAASISATSGAYKDEANIAINVAKDLKLGGTGNYVKVAVKDTYFQDGDIVEIVLRTDKDAPAWLQIFADEGTTMVAEMTSGVTKANPNYLTISGVPANTSALYLYRTEAADGNMNPYPTSMAVYRAMNPILTAIQFNSTNVAVTGTTVSALLPNGTNLGAMSVTPTIYWNGAGTAEVSGSWAWGSNTYVVTDKDGDATTYTINLTEDVLKHTVSYYDGATLLGTEDVEDGEHPTAAGIIAPSKLGETFQGWSTTDGGDVEDLNDIAISADDELYAVYAAIPCPTSGTVYKFEIKDGLASENLPIATDMDMSSYIDATGIGLLTYSATANNKATINSDGTIQLKDATAAYLKVELACALAAGDQIRAHVSNNPIRVQVGTTYDSSKDLILDKNAYDIVDITAAMEGLKVLYIARSTNGNANLADFEIYRRPALTGASLADLTMRQGQNKTPELTLEPSADAIVTSQVWEIVGEPTNLTGAAINGTTGVITTGTLNNPANNGTISVKVTLNGGSIEATCTVTVVDAIVQADVTKSTVWNWQNTGAAANIQLTNSSDPKKNENFVLANVAVNNNANFESDKLVVEGEYMVRDYNAANPYFQGQLIQFHTTVAGVVRVKFSHTGSNKPARELFVNGVGTGDTRTQATGEWSRYVEVPAGDVSLTAFHVDPADGAGQQYIRIFEIEFLEIIDSRTEYAAKDLGTACYEYDAVVIGATPYMVAGVNGNGYIVFDEITSGVIDAGYPYLFEAAGGKVFFCKPVGTTAAPLVSGEETSVKGMIGTFSGTTLTQGEDDICYFAGRHIWRVNDFSVDIDVDPHRCYVNYDVLRTKPAAAAAPGRRRVIMGVNGKDEAQGFENLESGDAPMKIMIDGTLYILRGEKVFDATGRLVK